MDIYFDLLERLPLTFYVCLLILDGFIFWGCAARLIAEDLKEDENPATHDSAHIGGILFGGVLTLAALVAGHFIFIFWTWPYSLAVVCGISILVIFMNSAKWTEKK